MNQFSGRASIWVAFLCVKKFEAIRAGGLCGWFMFYVDSPVCFTYNFHGVFPGYENKYSQIAGNIRLSKNTKKESE